MKEVSLPLENSSDFKFSVALEESYFTIRVIYNEIMQLHTLSLFDVDGTTIIAGVGLVPNYPILKDYIIPGLTGAFFLFPKTSVNEEFYKTYPQNLKDYYYLSYIYDDTSE